MVRRTRLLSQKARTTPEVRCSKCTVRPHDGPQGSRKSAAPCCANTSAKGGVEKHRLVYGGTVSLGATYVTEAASTLTPIGLRAQGVRPAATPDQSLGGADRRPRRSPPSRVGCDRAFGSAKVPPPPGVTPKPRDGEAQWIGVHPVHPHPPRRPEGGMGVVWGHPSPPGGVGGG